MRVDFKLKKLDLKKKKEEKKKMQIEAIQNTQTAL